jgi:hypothetical protein
MSHHVNVFQIEGHDAVWIENPYTLTITKANPYDDRVDIMGVIRETLQASGVDFSYHLLSEGDESPRSAPFTINQLEEDDDYEFEEKVFQLAWQEAKDAHEFLKTVVEPGTYQVVNRFGHAVGEEVEI